MCAHVYRDLLPLPGGGVRHPCVCALLGTLEQPLAVALEYCANGNLMTNLADRPDMLAWHHAGKRVALQVLAYALFFLLAGIRVQYRIKVKKVAIGIAALSIFSDIYHLQNVR